MSQLRGVIALSLVIVCGPEARATPTSPPVPSKAPAAGTIRVEPPAGVTFDIPRLPDEPAFAEPKARWWEKASPCPKGRKPVRNKNPIAPADRRPNSDSDWDHAIDCARGDVGDGPFVMLRKTGTRFREGYAADNKRHGLERQWFADGTLMRVAHYRSGPLEGPYKEQFANGTVRSDGNYVGDKKHGLWAEGTNGGFVARGYYASGQLEGRWVAELKGTTVLSVGYAKDQLHGDARLWRVTGEPLATGTFANGVGTWTSYYLGGSRAAVISCAGGKVVDATWFLESGAKLDDLRTINARSLSSSERWQRTQWDYVCQSGPLLLYTSNTFAPDHGP